MALGDQLMWVIGYQIYLHVRNTFQSGIRIGKPRYQAAYCNAQEIGRCYSER